MLKVHLKSSATTRTVRAMTIERHDAQRRWTTTLTISQLAARSGVAPSALRFYKERCLIRSARTASGHRRYERGTLRRVAFIVFAQRVGLPLDEIADALAGLPDHAVPTRADWEKLSVDWRERVERRIAELERLRDGLTECIGCGCLSLDRCRLANPADRAGRRGPGARFWLGDPRE